jgi:hypothetical protein
MPAFILISVVIGIAVALITIDWFFRDADESTASMEEFISRPRMPWWCSKFGVWLATAIASGFGCFHLLRFLWQKFHSFF